MSNPGGRSTTIPGRHVAQVGVNAIALGTADEVVTWKNKTGAKIKVISVTYTPKDALSGVDANNMALQVRNKGLLGTGTTGVTAVKTYSSGVDLVAFLADALVLSTTAADLEVDPEEVLSLDKTENGTGLALSEGNLTIEYEFIGK